MRIGVLSDLYIDKLGSPPIPEVLPDVLVLAGNIGCGTKGIEWAAKTYACPIIYVLGNYSYMTTTSMLSTRAPSAGIEPAPAANQTIFIRGVHFISTTPAWTTSHCPAMQ